MSSTTPAPERAPRDGAGEAAARPVPGSASVTGPAMRRLLAACAAAEAVSTPPGQPGPREHRTAA
ncbi:hypothetical protein [Kitasatospora sp. NPDC057223]|uniref:hypothetical protein n=1 Tax=Kitasatospora sp. NPDC057223 TaxID=3346055 RepID=UPI00362BA2D9